MRTAARTGGRSRSLPRRKPHEPYSAFAHERRPGVRARPVHGGRPGLPQQEGRRRSLVARTRSAGVRHHQPEPADQLQRAQPGAHQDITSITGTGGATLRGIDFRPKTGDLYGVGSDNIVYRVNPTTGIAIAEGPAFTPALNGNAFGVDFNPAADAIRVVSDAQQNLRLNPDAGTATQDTNLNPGMPQVVAAGYENSSFSFVQPLATTLHVVDAATDTLFTQTPPNNGTLINPRKLRGVDVGLNTGFDIAGDEQHGLPLQRQVRPRNRALHGRRADRQDEVARPHRWRQAPRGHRPRGLAGLTCARGRAADPAARPLRTDRRARNARAPSRCGGG